MITVQKLRLNLCFFTLFAVCSSPIVAQFDALGRRLELGTAPERRADNHLLVPIVLKSGNLNLPEPPGPVQACTLLYLLYCNSRQLVILFM